MFPSETFLGQNERETFLKVLHFPLFPLFSSDFILLFTALDALRGEKWGGSFLVSPSMNGNKEKCIVKGGKRFTFPIKNGNITLSFVRGFRVFCAGNWSGGNTLRKKARQKNKEVSMSLLFTFLTDSGYKCDVGYQSVLIPGKCIDSSDQRMNLDKVKHYKV